MAESSDRERHVAGWRAERAESMVESEPESEYDGFLITRYDLGRLRAIAKRLFSENRIDGDTMRNLAQTIEGITRTCEQIRLPKGG